MYNTNIMFSLFNCQINTTTTAHILNSMIYTICRSTDVQLETCAAYGQVSKEQSVSHYETVKHEENIYDN